VPFATGSHDATLASLTVHHWGNLKGGLAELRRVSSRQVIYTWDPAHPVRLWLWDDYLSGIADYERSRFPTLGEVIELSRTHTVVPFAIPHDFTDGLQHAWWRRPEAFLQSEVRAASSMFAALGEEAVESAMRRLRADLESGAWAERHADLLGREEMDYGYKMLIAQESLIFVHTEARTPQGQAKMPVRD
jgi:hypothetical protein